MLSRARLLGKEEGFTLIELLVVVAIIALLTAFAVPRLFSAINTSKSAAGQSDMETISGALERYYMANNEYPGPDAAAVKTALLGEYLKAGTKFKNGFNRGYLYQTSSDGQYYVLADPQDNAAGTVKVVCRSATTNWASNNMILSISTPTVEADLVVAAVNETVPTAAEIFSPGCALFPSTATPPYASGALKGQIVTN